MADKKQPKVAVVGQPTPADSDPFDLDNLSVASVSAEDLGVEKPILMVPVDKPPKQDFFRVRPEAEYRLDARVIKLEAERETYLVTGNIWPAIPGETRLVRLVTYYTRAGSLGLWPLSMPDDLLGKKDSNWGMTARKAAEIAETKWTRMQSNMGRGCYDVVTADKIPDPVWPAIAFKDIIRIAFGDGHLIDSLDHPVIRQLQGNA
jgi:hypothetical protein